MGRPQPAFSLSLPACPHVFQLTYTYEARKPSVKDKIIDMTFASYLGADMVLF